MDTTTNTNRIESTTDSTPATWDLVIADLQLEQGGRMISNEVGRLVIADARERDAVGRERYGVPLRPRNGRDSLWGAYEESLDLLAYVHNATLEEPAADPAWRFDINEAYQNAIDTVFSLRNLISRRIRTASEVHDAVAADEIAYRDTDGWKWSFRPADDDAEYVEILARPADAGDETGEDTVSVFVPLRDVDSFCQCLQTVRHTARKAVTR